MTAIFGWQDEHDAFLCGDSAVTRAASPLQMQTSSFGEQQSVDGVAVEESAVKILALRRNTAVGVCGDADEALRFLSLVNRDLEQTHTPLREILKHRGPAFRGSKYSFELLFAHSINGQPTITAFGSGKPMGTGFGESVVVLGSLPEGKQKLGADLISVVRRHPLPPGARLAAALVFLQAIGITDYLPAHGVGGSFFGIRLSEERLHWQEDINYFVYSPGVFSPYLAAKPGQRSEPPRMAQLEKVRVLVRDGAGIVLSSIGKPGGRLFLPPNSTRSESEWHDVVLKAVPPPFPLVVPSTHYGFLSSRFRKATYIHSLTDSKDCVVEIASVGRKANLSVPDRLAETLDKPTPQGRFDLSIATGDGAEIDCKTYRLKISET